MTPRKRNIIIIAIIAFMVLLGVILFFISNNRNTIPESGGSGVPEKGTVILENFDSLANDGSEITLGEFFTTDQQAKMREQLEAVLDLREPLDEYNGRVVDGTVSPNYDTNNISFTVHIAEFNTDYMITMNTISNAITIADSTGKKVN